MFSNTGQNSNNNNSGEQDNSESHDPNNRTANQISSGDNQYESLRGLQMQAPTDPHETLKQLLWLQQQQQLQQQQSQAEYHAAFASAAMAEKRLMASKRFEDATGAPYMHSNFGADPRAGFAPHLTNPYGMPSAQQNLMFPIGNIYPGHYSMHPVTSTFPNQGFHDSYSARQNAELAGASGMLDIFHSQFNGQSLDESTAKKAPKKKKVKDKNKPKRPLSSYNLFFKYERQRILKMIDDGEFVDGLSEPQGPTSTGERSVPKDSIGANTDVGQKEEEISGNNEIDTTDGKDNLIGSDKGDDKEETETADKERDTSATIPQRKPHGKISFENLAKLIGQRWKNLPEDELSKFKALADEDMKRYKDEIEAYLTRKQEQDESEEQQMKRSADSFANAESDYNYLNSYRMLQNASIPDMSFQHTLSQWDRTQMPQDLQALQAMGFDNQYQRRLQESQIYGLSQLQYLNSQHENQSIHHSQQQNQYGAGNFATDLVGSADNNINQGEPLGKKQKIDTGSSNQREE